MKINKLSFKRQNELEWRNENFTSHFNFIYNEKNATGKSTYIRMLLYAIGFAIPSTKKVKFEEFTFKTEIEIKNKILKIIRKNKKLLINDTEFSLPKDTQIIHINIFQDDSYDLIDNILGAIYIDQDRGWTLLNRGTVLGKIKFYIEEFLHGMKGKESDIDTKVKLRKLNDEIEKYKQMKILAEYKEQMIESTGELNFDRGEISFDTPNEELEKMRRELVYQKGKIEKEIQSLKKIVTDNKKFIEWLEQHNIFVKTQNGESILVTRNTIENYYDNTELNKIEMLRKQIALRNLSEKIAETESEMTNNQTLNLGVETILQDFDRKISSIPIDTIAVNKTISSLSKEQAKLREILRDSARSQNIWVDKLNTYIIDYAKELRIVDYLDKDYVFTHELKGISGAIYHKMVFIFRISYAKILSEKLGYKIPLFIDSPNGREVEAEAINCMINILKRDFAEHQIFLASIIDFIKESQENKKIKIDGKLFDLKTGQMSLFEEDKIE